MIAQKEQTQDVALIPQYSLSKILLVWAAAAIPMAILGWIVAPALAPLTQAPEIVRTAVLTVGLVWQFVLVMILLYREAGNLRWSTIRNGVCLSKPILSQCLVWHHRSFCTKRLLYGPDLRAGASMGVEQASSPQLHRSHQHELLVFTSL